MVADLSAHIEMLRRETRKTAVTANDREQYSTRNHLKIKGFDIPKAEYVDYCKVAADFVRKDLGLSTDDNEIELVHLLPVEPSATNARPADTGTETHSANERKSVVLLFRFRNRVA
jgi:hypothetical protein